MQLIQLPAHVCFPNQDTAAESFIDWVFPAIQERVQACLSQHWTAEDDNWFRDRAILTSRNELAANINEQILALLDASTDFVAKSVDSIVDPEPEDEVNFPSEYLNSLILSGLPPHELHLRRGAIVILIRNLNRDRGICNGCRCLVLGMSIRMLDVRILSGPSKGERLLLPRMRLDSSAQELPFTLRRRQFPIRLAWAMSIHKAQGQTLTRCGVYLPDPVFTHGQLYVAASRSSTPSGLKFLLGQNLGHGFQDSADNEFEGPYTQHCLSPSSTPEFGPARATH